MGNRHSRGESPWRVILPSKNGQGGSGKVFRGHTLSPGIRVDVAEDHHAFVKSLLPEEIQLLVLCDELYDGSWEEMRRDLEDRRDGKPFIFKLVNRIDEDLKRIDRLSKYEERHGLNLGDYLEDL